MHQRFSLENSWMIKWLWIGLLCVSLVSCSGETSTVGTAVPERGPFSPTPTRESTTAATARPPSPTHTRTAAPPTETALPPTRTNSPTPEPPTTTLAPTETQTITPSPWPTREAFFDGARVTFINNAGFLITVGDKKILIDALFQMNNTNLDPPQEVLQRAVNGDPPFDQIDLVIATHNHPDHFSADLVRDHLRNNELAVFVSSPEAVRQIRQMGDEYDERLIPVSLAPGESSRLSINGIELECLYITHGYDAILNIGVVITVDDYTFFHSGDMNADPAEEEAVSLADLQGYGFPQKEIDLAILPVQLFSVEEGIALIENGFHARYLSPMHYPYQYPPTKPEENYSNAVVFKGTMENWVVPEK